MTRRLHTEYGPNRDGLQDPARLTTEERRNSPAWLAEQLADSRSLSPTIQALRAAARKALGGSA